MRHTGSNLQTFTQVTVVHKMLNSRAKAQYKKRLLH